ncbi:hypothetical protein CBR_g32245 [Chara braunii]|uniref:UBP-type domain-containing protein n=1 Tax=Chara braunii TaxID=69332 RepID=A0A388JN70_CHABU|nr:hypothetical protein CBR_g32245 [Chara braunii]|eukprot:GBG59228.1 hypothetical protein CBR_g32245 [Chara braunii]
MEENRKGKAVALDEPDENDMTAGVPGAFEALRQSHEDAALARALQAEMDGQESGWVEARTSCPHAWSVCEAAIELPRFDAVCEKCGDQSENWVCLTCKKVYCGRYVNMHMLEHQEECGHPVVLGFRDLSCWCHLCSSYLDGQLIQEVEPFFNMYHLMKFGSLPIPR